MSPAQGVRVYKLESRQVTEVVIAILAARWTAAENEALSTCAVKEVQPKPLRGQSRDKTSVKTRTAPL
jgi:hypothetical protein